MRRFQLVPDQPSISLSKVAMGNYTIPIVIAAMSGAAVLGTRAVPKGENQLCVDRSIARQYQELS